MALVEPADLREEGRHYLAGSTTRAGFTRSRARSSGSSDSPRSPSPPWRPTRWRRPATCGSRASSGSRATWPGSRPSSTAPRRATAVLIACHNAAEVERLGEVFGDTALAQQGRLHRTIGRIRAGFHLIDASTLVIADHELFARADVRRTVTRRRYESRAIDSFLDLNEGDLVVHVNHGIARYRGLQFVDKSDEHAEETLLLEFAEGTKLYVPIAKIDLVQKYVGGGKAAPVLSKIGSSTWEKRKKRVAEAVVDLAQELLDINAQRASQPGFAYPAEDSHWMAEFEAAFPFEETPDQLTAIEATKRDMAQTEADGPPDLRRRRLRQDRDRHPRRVQGGRRRQAGRRAGADHDPGRAAPPQLLGPDGRVPVRDRGRQPVPAPSPRSARSSSGPATGGVDILIGTHRILQKDVAFKDLGLVIIDEEQRFGVEDKEWLKTFRSTVDVLTLSATPIPRTLHMSLLGIRDISNLETPPPDRKAIETRIIRFDAETIKRAIHRELNRDGQVYFVHNRIYDIESVADKIQSIVPEAKIAIAHGQMGGEALERTMLAFIRRKFDILVATTIIESGLDIPNVNTIFINEADKYGLADLHQLRGRVGRFKHRAYAYLLLESDRPVTPNAVKRLKAIEEFTSLGAGFKIALRDLEIRGAGNILGPEQSGHIESVGYELYCSLLESAVRVADPPAGEAALRLLGRALLARLPAARLCPRCRASRSSSIAGWPGCAASITSPIFARS